VRAGSHVDQTKFKRRRQFLNYLKSKYIGTLGCFTSPKLCGKWLNRPKGLSQCCLRKLLIKFVEVTFTRETGEEWKRSREVTPKKLGMLLGSRRRASPFLPALKDGVSWRY